MALELPGGWVGENLSDPSPFPLWAKWLSVRDSVPTSKPMGFKSINDAHLWSFNTITYQPEPFGVDKWQTPDETIALGKGDCEDLALLDRAMILQNRLLHESDMWLLIVYDLVARLDHALLWLPTTYLDSRCRDQLPAASFADYRPICGFSGNQAELFGKRV